MSKDVEFLELNGKQCAEIALHMYEIYLEEMKPPVFAIIPFNDWLNKLIKSTNQDS